MNILVADDEIPLARFICKGLLAEGFVCTTVNDFNQVVSTVKSQKPNILVLDRLFGDEDSLQLLDKIKALPSAPMVLMLTALDEVAQRVKGLQQGADDYLCKPFDFDELLARIEALRRRIGSPPSTSQNSLIISGLEIRLDERIAWLHGEELYLTKLEFELLLYLAQNTGKVMSRERILSRVWQAYSDPQTNIIDVYISKLRKKLDSEPTLTIQTLRGNGYRLANEQVDA
ncbi:response regulator transcription factor [Alteromonas flava]|uniref:response regulator transcription factor n=1 Tax=Alteromonas flava TaxID=2048003 RepID=UPI000C281BE3|nr:response regulator transcription factor [Alteromonas flava]